MHAKALFISALLTVILLAGGCAKSEEAAQSTAGDLSLIQAQSGAQSGYVTIGEAVVEDPGSSVSDRPAGVTIGRVSPGSYPVYASNDGWLQVALAEGKSGPRFGWIPASSAQFHVGG